MATSKPALSGTPAAARPQVVTDSEQGALDRALQQSIAERAYLLYEASGRQDGYDQEHWMQAESEILRRGLDVRESGSWVSMVGTLPDAADEDVQVFLEPHRVVVRAQRSTVEQDADSQRQVSVAQEMFVVEDLNIEVEPATATASFKDKTLTLMVKKRYPTSGAPEPARPSE